MSPFHCSSVAFQGLAEFHLGTFLSLIMATTLSESEWDRILLYLGHDSLDAVRCRLVCRSWNMCIRSLVGDQDDHHHDAMVLNIHRSQLSSALMISYRLEIYDVISMWTSSLSKAVDSGNQTEPPRPPSKVDLSADPPPLRPLETTSALRLILARSQRLCTAQCGAD